tara:strand:- start:248 stop:511 length:264 start_codon:yes stop_codon:yes gene_type:complete
MTFDEFTSKLALIQADKYLSIDATIDIKQKIVGLKKLYDCSEIELDKILKEYRKEYRKRNSEHENKNEDKHKFKKSKHKYTRRKDWD